MLTDRQEHIIEQALENFDFTLTHQLFEQLGLTFGEFPPFSKAYVPTEEQIIDSVRESLVQIIFDAQENGLDYIDVESSYFRLRYWVEDEEDGGEEVIIIDFQPVSKEMRYGTDGSVCAINGEWEMDH